MERRKRRYEPVRKVNTRGAFRMTGRFSSYKMKRCCSWESSIEKDFIPHFVTLFYPYAYRTFQVFTCILMPQFQCVNIGQHQIFLTFELIFHQTGQYFEIHIQQRRKRTDINHVLEQLSLSRVVVMLTTDSGEGYSYYRYIIAVQA